MKRSATPESPTFQLVNLPVTVVVIRIETSRTIEFAGSRFAAVSVVRRRSKE